MAIHDTNGANGLTVENKVLEIRRTNSSSTADTDKLNFTFNTTLGYKTRIGEDTDYTSDSWRKKPCRQSPLLPSPQGTDCTCTSDSPTSDHTWLSPSPSGKK